MDYFYTEYGCLIMKQTIIHIKDVAYLEVVDINHMFTQYKWAKLKVISCSNREELNAICGEDEDITVDSQMLEDLLWEKKAIIYNC